MYKPHQLQLLIRIVLAWFVLTLTVAAASPWVSTPSFDLVCTGSGLVKLSKGDADNNLSAHTLDCPACLPGMGPSPQHEVDLQAQHLSQAWTQPPWLSADLTATHKPFAPRAPPALSS
jgi:hypothetical protein